MVNSRAIITEKEKKSEEKLREVDPKLKDFIDRVIVPALVREWLAEEQSRPFIDSPSDPQTNESTEEPA